MCSYCDPTSLEKGWNSPPANGQGRETCLDYKPEQTFDPRIDEKFPEPQGANEYPCSTYNGLNLFQGCQCSGTGDLADRLYGLRASTFKTKRLSKYRKRQMEADPKFRWLLDIMCYDKGNVVLSPYHEYVLLPGSGVGDEGVVAEAIVHADGGTLYNHLIGVVHCEQWYEVARCPQNPEHNDPNGTLGGWIVDQDGVVVGANTSKIAPRFWIYACSGVPIFDFEIQRARTEFDEFGSPFISEDDYQHIIEQFAQQRTPRQEVMLKLAKAGLFDIGDWRQEALNEIQMLKGMSYTAKAYGAIQGYTGTAGACCLYGISGIDGITCAFMEGVSCGLSGGQFFLGRQCTSELCVNCSGFKPKGDQKSAFARYLGPVRKKLFVPFNPAAGQFGINYRDPTITGSPFSGVVTRPAFLDPRKARPNTPDRMLPIPLIAKGQERDFKVEPDDTLVDLQLPKDLLPMPWGDFTDPAFWRNGNTLPVYIPGEAPSEEFQQFSKWTDTQWLYLHARPGGWDYVCSGYFDPDVPSDGYRIPNLRRRYAINGDGVIGACLDGVKGWPQRSYELSGGGCPDIRCGTIRFEPDNPDPIYVPAPVVGCEFDQSCQGIDCVDGADCSFYPEQGGGAAPCRGVQAIGNCDGMRFLYYRHRFVGGSDAAETHPTCNGVVNSFLYRVNLDVGNYGNYCPHICRTKQTPSIIAQNVPNLDKNKLGYSDMCSHLRNDQPVVGTMCPGLYCFTNNIPQAVDQDGNPIPPFYGSSPYCCGGKQGSRKQDYLPIFSYLHDASNRNLCPLYPGPPCLTPQCRLYDGRFVGTYLNFNPVGCCWKCKIDQQTGLPSPDTYVGAETLFGCENMQPEEILRYDGNISTGRGFIPVELIGSETLNCGTTWAGQCACGGINSPPLITGLFCEPLGGLSGNDDPA